MALGDLRIPLNSGTSVALTGDQTVAGVKTYTGHAYFKSGIPWFDVRAYGAVGDGVTDDTAAVQAAIDDAYSIASGGIVHIPSRTFIVSQLRLKSRVRIFGDGRASILKALAGADVATLILDHDHVEQVMLAHLLIDGNKANQTLATAHGVYLVNTQTASTQKTDSTYQIQDPSHHLEDVFILNTKGDGLHMEGRGGARIHNVRIWRADGKGFHMGAADSHLSMIDVGESGAQGIYVAGGAGEIPGSNTFWTNISSWYSGRLDAVNAHGIEIAAKRVTMSTVQCQDNTKHGLVFNSTAADCVVDAYTGDSNSNSAVNSGSNAYSGTSGYGVLFSGATNCRVTGQCFDRTAVPCQRGAVVFGSSASTGCVAQLISRNNVAHVLATSSLAKNRVEINAQDGTESPAFAASYTPDPYLGRTKFIGALTANIAVNNPTAAHQGQYLELVFAQDGTGGRTVTWGAAFITTWQPDQAASAVSSAAFCYDGTSWQHVAWAGAQRASTVAETHSSTTVVNTTVETALASLTLPAGAAQVGDIVRFTAWGNMINNTAGSITVTWRLKLGATSIMSSGANGHGQNANRRRWKAQADFVIESLSAERCGMTVDVSNASSAQLATQATASCLIGDGTAAEALTADKVAALLITFGTADALCDAVCIGTTLEVIRKRT